MPNVTRRTKGISPRERELLLDIVNNGYNVKALCKRLGISKYTYRTHMITVFLELQVDCILDAVLEAIRRGIIPPVLPRENHDQTVA
jgi:DNA-binding NarL/FixJ family response regulator